MLQHGCFGLRGSRGARGNGDVASEDEGFRGSVFREDLQLRFELLPGGFENGGGVERIGVVDGGIE